MSRTAGNWHQDGLKIIGNGYAIATINSHKTTEGAANARLIAAAPELLEALEAIVRSAERNQAAINLPLLANASAAIAKARGQYRSAVGIEHGITQQIESDAAGEFPIAKARGE